MPSKSSVVAIPPPRDWSPELVDYLCDHPERARETLEIVSSDDYRDGYYDQLSESD